MKPLDTFARESARRIAGAKPFTGGETVNGMDAVEWSIGLLSNPERWQREPIVRVAHAELRRAVGLPASRDRFSYEELVAHEGLRSAIAEPSTRSWTARTSLDPARIGGGDASTKR